MSAKLIATFNRIALSFFTVLALAPLLTVAVGGVIH
ncbi:MAG: hypothetical protein JWQ97_2101 [Phenylobacterium sp.]|nr:hypothetical protein [Phenylobacterium sp.]